MNYAITKNTQLSEFPFVKILTDAQKYEILKHCDFDFGNITVNELIALKNGEIPTILTTKLVEEPTVCNWVLVNFGLPNFLKQFEQILIKNTLKTGNNTQTVSIEFDEAIYIFCQKFFALKSFKEISNLTVNDYIFAVKSNYVDAYNSYVESKKFKSK